MQRRFLALCLSVFLTSLLAPSLIAARGEPLNGTVEIRRTSYGIPHIKAADERGLGYGIGYAYAEDNLCLLAEEIVTVNGSRSKYFGGAARNDDGIENLKSDFFFRWLNADDRIDLFLKRQKPEIKDLMIGYAVGYNAYLHKTDARHLPRACRDGGWVRDISERDIAKLIRRLTVLNGVERFVEALVSAAPPKENDPVRPNLKENGGKQNFGALPTKFEETHGSNAIALGRALTQNGSGLLLGNPHFPWSGALRFYEMHLTIPSKIDVMGAALPGLPAINIGFSHSVAWSHTVDRSGHMTIYRLELDPQDSTRYIVGRRSLPMQKRLVDIEVLGTDGTIAHQTHVFYETMLGPVLSDARFVWTQSVAFTIQDANFDNDRALEQWVSMDRADSLDRFEKSVETILGIPWVDTIAADRNGNVMFMNVSSIPGVDAGMIATCSFPSGDSKGPPIVLDGSKPDCDWKNGFKDTRGLLDPGHLPVLKRGDYVQNSNGSAWLTNPLAPLIGFSPLVSKETGRLGERTRFALDWLQGATGKAKNGKGIEAEDLQTLLFSNKVYLATLMMNDVLTLCASLDSTLKVDLGTICHALSAWDRTAGVQSNSGYLYFDKFAEIAVTLPKVWAIPFDPAQPVSTPRGLNIKDPVIAHALADALRTAQSEVAKLGLLPDVKWGQIQQSAKGGRSIPIPGGSSSLGVYNVIQSKPLPNGKREVKGGSSYIQIVSFDEDGPVAKAILTFSESSNPDSAHYADQTELFSRSQLIRLPFSEEEIMRDPAYRLEILPVPH